MTVIFHFAFLTESEKSYTKIFIFIGFLKAVNEALLFLSSFCTLSVVSYERSSYVNRLVLDDNSTNAHYIIRTYILHQNQKKNIHPYMLYSMFYSITARPNRLCFTIWILCFSNFFFVVCSFAGRVVCVCSTQKAAIQRYVLGFFSLAYTPWTLDSSTF